MMRMGVQNLKFIFRMNNFTTEEQKEEAVIRAFFEYFIHLDIKLPSQKQLFEPNTLLSVLDLMEDLDCQQGLSCKSEIDLCRSQLVTFKKIISILDNYEKNVLGCQIKLKIDVYEICMHKNSAQLSKLLIRIFKIMLQVPNKQFFISSVIKLCPTSQQIFASLLKQDILFNQQIIKKKPEDLDEQIELIDKIYEFEQENEKLVGELNELHHENKKLNENVTVFQRNSELLRVENEEYRLMMLEYEELVENLRFKNEKEKQTEVLKENREEVNKMLREFNEKQQLMKVQNEGLKTNYEHKIKELNDLVKSEKEKNLILSNNLEMLRGEIQQLLDKSHFAAMELFHTHQLVTSLQQKNQQHEDKIATLKFQLSYKDSQIEELKEFVLNGSSSFQKDESECRKLGQMHSTMPSPRSMVSLDMQELKTLRIQVKQLQREVFSYQNLKKENKELEYERKKLVRILQEYEMSRGEENQILSGCVYQLRLRLAEGKK